MDEHVIRFVLQVTNQALLVTVVVCGPPIVISMVVGLIVSLFQAVTQIHEQTLTFVPKMVVIFGSLAIMGPWIGGILMRFTRMCFEDFHRVLY